MRQPMGGPGGSITAAAADENPGAVAVAPTSERRSGSSLAVFAPFVVLGLTWQVASLYAPPYLFPGLQIIGADVWRIVTTWDLLYQGVVTWLRLVAAVLLSLVIGIPIGLAMGVSRRCDEFIRPLVKFVMAVPALNWVILVVVWFSTIELRIAFVLLMLCTPVTVLCVYDGVRSIDNRLTDMVLAFGASRLQHVRLLLWPYVKAFALTATKLNVGIGIRAVIVAEVVGAPTGIGRELDLAKNVFDLSSVLAWTLIMVAMLMAMTFVIELTERTTLRWRIEGLGQS